MGLLHTILKEINYNACNPTVFCSTLSLTLTAHISLWVYIYITQLKCSKKYVSSLRRKHYRFFQRSSFDLLFLICISEIWCSLGREMLHAALEKPTNRIGTQP